MCVCVRVLDQLELELQTVVSCHMSYPGPLEEQPVLLIAEPSLQPLCHLLIEPLVSVWWLTPVIPIIWRLRRKSCHEFKANIS